MGDGHRLSAVGRRPRPAGQTSYWLLPTTGHGPTRASRGTNSADPRVRPTRTRGSAFSHAFVSAPSCSPSRAAILTGQHFWRLEEGAILWSTLPAKFPVYPDLLEKAGYHVGHAGKGWGPGPIAPGGRGNPAGPLYKSFQQFLELDPKASRSASGSAAPAAPALPVAERCSRRIEAGTGFRAVLPARRP